MNFSLYTNQNHFIHLFSYEMDSNETKEILKNHNYYSTTKGNITIHSACVVLKNMASSEDILSLQRLDSSEFKSSDVIDIVHKGKPLSSPDVIDIVHKGKPLSSPDVTDIVHKGKPLSSPDVTDIVHKGKPLSPPDVTDIVLKGKPFALPDVSENKNCSQR